MGYKYRDVPMPYPFAYFYPVSYVIDPVSTGIKAATGKPVFPVCTLEGKHISTFDNRTTKADMDDCFHLLSGDCSKAMSYGVPVRSLESSSSYSPETKKEVKVFIGSTDVTMKPEGENVIVKVNGSPIEVPMSERHTIMGREGRIVAKIIKSKDNVVILKSSKISALFDGKRIKLEGSNLMKNKLCGLCGDNNNNKLADVPSPRKCLLSTPKLEHARNEYCFSRIPLVECGDICHPAGMREKRVSFTCMSKSDRRTMHILEKIRAGKVVPELMNLPESFSHEKSVPVECKPYTIHGAGIGNSLY